MRCNIYTTPLASIGSSVVAFLGILYTYIGVGLSALLVSTCRAMREPQFVERATGLTPRLFLYVLVSGFRQQRSRLTLFVNGIGMNLLQHNPYRLLGVYSNSPTKERLANHNRMKAFLKVGKPVSFPLDLTQYLGSIERT